MDLTRKIGAGFVAASVATVAVGGWALGLALAARAEASGVHEHQVALERAVSVVRADTVAYDGALTRYVLVTGTHTPDAALGDRAAGADATVQGAKAALARDLLAVRSAADDRELRERLGQVAAALGDYDTLATKVYGAVAVGQPDDAAQIQATQIPVVFGTLATQVDAAVARSAALSDAGLAAVDRRQRDALLVGSGLVLAVLGALLGLARYVDASIRRFRLVEEGIEALSVGDLRPRDVPETDDEVGRMNAVVDRTAQTLRALVEDVDRRKVPRREVRPPAAESGVGVGVEADRFRGQYRVLADALAALNDGQRVGKAPLRKAPRRR